MRVSNTDSDKPWRDPDEAPELTDDWFAKATLMQGEAVVRRSGRPQGSAKEQVTLRLDKAVLAHFRATGPGWQTRVNEALRRMLRE
jgi:uncharacterized protein (DUF4415 family)